MESSPGQTLSPEAAVFVPRQGFGAAPSPFPLQQIPAYMTNCYPFVQGDFNRMRGGLGRGPRSPRYPGSKPARNIPGFVGNRLPGPHNFGPPVSPFPVGGVDPPWPPPVLPMTPLINNLFPDTDNSVTVGDNSCFVTTEGQGHNLPKYPNSSRRQQNKAKKEASGGINQEVPRNNAQKTLNNNIMNDIGPERSFEGGSHGNSGYRANRRGGRGRRKEWQRDIQSVGDRGDASGNTGNRQRKDSRTHSESESAPCIPFAGGHTIIVKETSVQTDFPESFANLTLMSHPSSLYLPSLRESTSNFKTPSDSDADSDSGYNSPLHRKNRTFNSPHPSTGTHPMVHVPVQSPKSASSLSHPPPFVEENVSIMNSFSSKQTVQGMSNQTESPPKLSYAFMAQKKPPPPSPTKINERDVGNMDASKQDKIAPSSEERTKKEKGSRRGRKSRSSKSESEVKPSPKGQPLSGLSDKSEADDKKENIEDVEGEGKKKRKRKRKRKKKKKEGEETDEVTEQRTERREVELHFEDEEEFPDLAASATSGLNKSGGATVPFMSYSAMLKSTSVPRTPAANEQDDDATKLDEVEDDTVVKEEVKSTRRRRRRQEMIQKAADEELAEISLEQQMLRELNLKPKQKSHGKDSQPPGILKVTPQPQASGKKSKQAVSLDLSAMIDALEKKKTDVPKKKEEQIPVKKKAIPKQDEKKKPGLGHNLLDSSAPVKRGKERENPKPKKPSSLKKVILKEREEKKKLKLLDDSESNNAVSLGIGIVCGNESDLSQDAMSTKSMSEYISTPASNDLSPISQTSPISMSPLSPGVSPQSSEVNSPIAGMIGKEVRMKIHSRRFREYCNQVLNKDIDNCCTDLLKDLVRFQDRMYHKDPTKAKSKRRIVLGLREVTKHLKLKKIKCVIISPNLEKIQSKGGLDDALNNILNLCNEQNIPFVFALGRRALGRACAKLVPVSVVGIFNYEGSNENFHRLMELSEQARQAYKEMVNVIEKEIRDYPTLGAAAAVPHIYAHMGHSRTPSGASVLSFTSSILSEPISENYPHSEPETDSKGYEIVKDDRGLENLAKITQLKMNGPGMQELKSQMIYPSVNVDIDDGNEADTEDYGLRKMGDRQGQGRSHSFEDYNGDDDSDQSSEQGSDTVKALPHIDSIHSSMQELNTEILSQTSGRTYDNCDAISTHSSRTLGDGSSTILADAGERSRHDTPKSAGSPSSTLQRGKVIDAERIQNWVHQTQSRLENLQQSQNDSGDDSDSDSGSSDNENLDEETNSDLSKFEGKQEKGHNSDDKSQSTTSQDENLAKCTGTENSDPEHTFTSTHSDLRSSHVNGASSSKQETSQVHLPSIAESSEASESEASGKEKDAPMNAAETTVES